MWLHSTGVFACPKAGQQGTRHQPQHIDDDAQVAGHEDTHLSVGPVVLEVLAALAVHEQCLTPGEVDDEKYKHGLTKHDEEAERLVLQQPDALKPVREGGRP